MAIKTNHTADSLTPESGVLKISSTGAIALPAGQDSERPVINAAGYVRFASQVASPEYYDGAAWQLLTSKEYVDSRIGTSSGQSIADVIAALSLNDLTDVALSGTSDNQLLSYDVSRGQFVNKTQALSIITRTFISNGQSMTFDIITNVSSVQNLVVSINGIQQEPFYSFTLVNGHIVQFDEAPEAGDRIQVKILNATVATDRPRPRIINVSYGSLSGYATITITATDIARGTGARIGLQAMTRIDYPSENTMQLMIENSRLASPIWSAAQNLTLVDTSGNEFTYEKIINFNVNESKPYWTNSNSYIGTFSGGDTINFALSVNNATSYTISPAYAGETAISWLTISNNSIVGTAPQNSTPSRYEISVTASNGSVNITKNFWLLVV